MKRVYSTMNVVPGEHLNRPAIQLSGRTREVIEDEVNRFNDGKRYHDYWFWSKPGERVETDITLVIVFSDEPEVNEWGEVAP